MCVLFEQLDGEGGAEVEFTYKELFELVYNTYSYWYAYNRQSVSLNYKTFDFQVNVTDKFTDDVMTAEASLTFYDSPLKLRFMSITPSAYKPGLPFVAYVSCHFFFFP